MIITRTPFRISFFGGGTDYPVWFRENEGAVLATAINKYCYISVRRLPPFFDYSSRIVWSKMEHVTDPEEIEHPSVRELLKYMSVKEGISLHHDADLPARSGLGSSSAFTVGLLHALYGLQGTMISKQKLAEEAIHIEQNILKECVGCQDQVTTAYGGFNRVDFAGDGCVNVSPIIINPKRLERFQNHLLLFFTGFSRTASDIARRQIEETHRKKEELRAMYRMVREGTAILQGSEDLLLFGKLLDEGWKLKRGLTGQITNTAIDEIYETAVRAGAVGGKILGAGGGGFILFFAEPEKHCRIKEALKHLLCVPFRFQHSGSQIIFYEPNGFRQE